MMTVIFDPVAQNTIVRPMAQAVCLAQGGKPVEYVDTSDQKKKVINEGDLTWLDLKVDIKGRQIPVSSSLVTLRSKYGAVQVLVLVNDVVVKVTSKTTVQQAMAQFHRKYAAQNRITRSESLDRQRES